MGDVAIRVEGLGKSYAITHQRQQGGGGYKTLQEDLRAAVRWPLARLRGERSSVRETFWALHDVSFEVKHGEVLGIIGRNGAGKSTLLKILSRITEPSVGHADIYGRIGSLLEVGTGFHPELTGRENIYLNGAILGMTRGEILRKFDEIVDFAEIAQFLDTPVKRYSSGMYMRLAFAVAAHLDPEVLVIDEVLAVGDAAFQKKCLGKMKDVAREGRTVLFVSHDMGAIHSLTRTCLHLEAGTTFGIGKTEQIISQYAATAWAQLGSQSDDLTGYRRDRGHDSPVHISRLWVAQDGQQVGRIELGTPITVCMEIEAQRKIEGANVMLTIKSQQGNRVATFFSSDQDFALFAHPGKQLLQMQLHGLPLAPGRYYADIGLNQSLQTTAYEVLLDVPLFEVVNNGQVLHWQDRPWGMIHWNEVEWKMGVE